MSSWKPIETAPKDGTIVDLWNEDFGRSPDCFWGLPQHSCGEAGSYCDDEWHGATEGWVLASFNIFAFEDGFTHWMPAADPPAGDMNTGGNGAEIIEKCLEKATNGDPNDAPFPLVGREAKLWHRAQEDAYRHALEMLVPSTMPTPGGGRGE